MVEQQCQWGLEADRQSQPTEFLNVPDSREGSCLLPVPLGGAGRGCGQGERTRPQRAPWACRQETKLECRHCSTVQQGGMLREVHLGGVAEGGGQTSERTGLAACY